MSAPRFSPQVLEEIRQRLDIVEIISEHVALKKKGRDYQGLCPFHDEKTPSFSVSPAKQAYYCFGCQAGGNAIKFLMEIQKTSFSETVLDLARRYQIPVQTLAPEEKREYQRQLSLREQLYEILAVAAQFYHHALFQPQGETARHYLKEKRRLSDQTIQTFQLGYAPEGWEALYGYLVEQKNYPRSLVEEAGLIQARQQGSGHYDRFRNRLLIPIRDDRGRVIAFGGRALGAEEPKYLNSPETPLFSKGKILFGLDRAKKAIQKADRAIVVEGYFDVMALHGRGIENAVAALGTALSQEQVKALLRYTDSKQIIFNFDADKAGVKAAQRAIEETGPLVYSGLANLRILNLPAGKDADEFLLGAPDAVAQYQELVEQAPLWIDWQLDQLLAGQNLKQGDQFQAVAQGMIALLQRLEDANQQLHYLQVCAERLSQGNSSLASRHFQALQAQLRPVSLTPRRRDVPQAKPILKNPENSRLREAESLLLLLYLHCPSVRSQICQALEEQDLLFSFAEHRLLWRRLRALETDLGLTHDPENQLLAQTPFLYGEDPAALEAVAPLLFLTENAQAKLNNPELQIQGALSVLERETWLSYSRYCLGRLNQLHDPQTNPEQFRYFTEELQKARRRAQALDQGLRFP
jgi:DNA primase